MQFEVGWFDAGKIIYKSCACCGKEFNYSRYVDYKYKFDPTNSQGHKGRQYFCSYSCYIKGKANYILQKRRLTKDDAMFLLEHHYKVPWEKCSVTLRRLLER